MTQNGVIETVTGILLRAGFSDFVAGAGEALRSDVPVPAQTRHQEGQTQMHRWNGTAWVLTTNPAAPLETSILLQSPDGSRWRIKVNNAGAVITESL